jgi:release factor glutamine methyltransferase
VKIKELLKKGSLILEKRAAIFIAHTPILDAELILCHVLGVDRLRLFLDHEKEVSRQDADEFMKLIGQRYDGRPIAYITGEQEFMGIEFEVNENVLIPRPDTEILVESVLGDFSESYGKRAGRTVHIADIGTGSGAIAVSLAKLIGEANVTAFDISKAALEVASKNAEKNGVSSRTSFVEIDVMSTDEIVFYDGGTRHTSSFDAIVSNPPYIRSGEMEDLPVSVRDFEPVGALDGGEDGLVFYRRICRIGTVSLRKGGKLYFEVGHDQSEQVSSLMEECGYRSVITKTDLQGFQRVVIGTNP